MEFTNKFITDNIGKSFTQIPTKDASGNNGDHYLLDSEAVAIDASLYFKADGYWSVIRCYRAFAP